MHPVALTSVLFLHFMLSDCICSCEGTGKEFLPSRFQMARRHVNVRTKMGECRHLEQYRFYECSACGGSQDFATSFLNVFHLPWLQLFVHVYLLMLKAKI